MKPSRILAFSQTLIIIALTGVSLGGCGPAASPSPAPTPVATYTGQVKTTYIPSAGVGDVAVMIGIPQNPRYPEGAGVVVMVSPLFNPSAGFQTTPDMTSLGLIQVSYLWPGYGDSATGLKSGGIYDFGGAQSIQVLQDVIRYASGQIPDKDGRYLSSFIHVTPLSGEVGLYAFSDAGLAAVNVLSLDGDTLSGVQYYVGRENPTVDTLVSLEAGYWDDTDQVVSNPFYIYPASYGTHAITLNYSNVRWDATSADKVTGTGGDAYLDLDGSGTVSSGDYVLPFRTPIMFGKRYYSVALTQALLDNQALTTTTWPADLATPQEASREWAYRQSTGRYLSLRQKMPDLKVMLVFAQRDSNQVAADKPHIHQAFQGFRFEAGLWVRLNPDRAYVESLNPPTGMEYPDNPANTQPADWTQIGPFAYPVQAGSADLVPLSAVAEMADRAHFGRWDENLGQVLYIYFPPTQTK